MSFWRRCKRQAFILEVSKRGFGSGQLFVPLSPIKFTCASVSILWGTRYPDLDQFQGHTAIVMHPTAQGLTNLAASGQVSSVDWFFHFKSYHHWLVVKVQLYRNHTFIVNLPLNCSSNLARSLDKWPCFKEALRHNRYTLVQIRLPSHAYEESLMPVATGACCQENEEHETVIDQLKNISQTFPVTVFCSVCFGQYCLRPNCLPTSSLSSVTVTIPHSLPANRTYVVLLLMNCCVNLVKLPERTTWAGIVGAPEWVIKGGMKILTCPEFGDYKPGIHLWITCGSIHFLIFWRIRWDRELFDWW